MNDPLAELSDCGVSVWLDDLSRDLLADGEIQALIAARHVVGVTTNPTSFASALADGGHYDAQMRTLAADATTVDEAIFAITTDDICAAADLLTPVFTSTRGVDGWVSAEVDPRLARDADATVAAARALAWAVDRPNVLVKIPATREGLAAITATIAAGISVNVTLIFSQQRYRDVIDAYLTGLEEARRDGLPLGEIHSVASFFVSRVDSNVDARLDALGTDHARALKHRAGLANGRLAYDLHRGNLTSSRWRALAAAGANPQRPLWASTGVKDPAYPDTTYIDGLIVTGTITTMARSTLAAFADHGSVVGDTVTGRHGQAEADLAALDQVGINLSEVAEELERDALMRLEASWADLSDTIEHELELAHSHNGSPRREGTVGGANAERASRAARARTWLLVSIAIPLIYRLATRSGLRPARQILGVLQERTAAPIARLNQVVNAAVTANRRGPRP